MRILNQSTAANVMVFMTDSSDHVTGKASLTLTITASKDGAAFGSITPAVTERGNGWYSLALTTSHTDTLGDLALHVTSTGADPTDVLCRVSDYSEVLKVNLTGMTGEASRSLLNAIRKLMNKVAIAGATLTVYKEDDSTAAYTQTIATDSGQLPIQSLDTT